MALSPVELRAEFIRRRNAGEPMPTPTVSLVPRESSPPAAPAIVIDRDADKGEQLEQIMRAAGAIIGGWTLRAVDTDDRDSRRWLDGREGAAILGCVGRWGVGPDRIEFMGDWPAGKIDGYRFSPYHGDRSEYSAITVSLKRSAEAIAGELERRFLPGYLSEYGKRLKDRDTYDEQLREQARITCDLAEIIGAEPRYQCTGRKSDGLADHFYGVHGPVNKCNVNQSGDVELELRTDEDTAAAVLRLIKGRGER